MGFRYKIIVIVLMLFLVVSALSACTTSLDISTALIIEDVEIADRLGAKAKIYISVTEMPGRGIAAIQANVGSFSWDPDMFEVLDAQGLNDFTVLAESFNNNTGTGGFAAVNPSAGVVNGNILEIIIKRMVPSDVTSTGVELVESNVLLGDTANNVIANYTMVSGEARLKD